MSHILFKPQYADSGYEQSMSLQWRYNERDGVSNHQRLDCLLNRVFKQNTKDPRHWHLSGESTGDRWIPFYKGPVAPKIFTFDDVIMEYIFINTLTLAYLTLSKFRIIII